jgi:hypothetical protein
VKDDALKRSLGRFRGVGTPTRIRISYPFDAERKSRFSLHSSESSDKNDGLTRESAIYSWGRARKLPTGHLEINVDSASARKRLMAEMQKAKKN